MFRRYVKHSMESALQFSFRSDCNNTADVPSFTLRPPLSAIPFVFDLFGVNVEWFQFGSKNFCKLIFVSCEVFDLHGYDWTN